MELITGRTGTAHVYAADDAEIYKLFLGNGDFVLQTGNKLQARRSQSTPNGIEVLDGSIMMQGRLAKIRPGDGFDTLTYSVGTPSYKRVDYIIAEYSRTVTTSEVEIEGEIVTVTDKLENVTLKIVQGTPSATGYTPPTLVTNNIDTMGDGDVHQMLLWEIRLDGMDFSDLIDHRIVTPNAAPIQTALDYATGAVANIRSYINGITPSIYASLSRAETDIAAELDRIMGLSRIAPLVVVSASSITASSGVLTITSQTYTYTAGDVFVVYLNGMRIPASDYEVSGGTGSIIVELEYGTNATYDEVEVEVWRPES